MDPSCIKYKDMLEALQPTAEQMETETPNTDNETIGRGTSKNTDHFVDVSHQWTVQGGKLKSNSLSESETEDTAKPDRDEESDELADVDMPLEEVEGHRWTYDSETGNWRSVTNKATTTEIVDTEAKNDNPMDSNSDIQDVETLGCQQPFRGEVPDLVKSCEPHRAVSMLHRTVRRVGGARIKSRRKNNETHGDMRSRKPSVSKSTTMECETKLSKDGDDGSDGLTTDSGWDSSISSKADEIKELLNDWMQKAYEKIMICLIWLIALLWTALVFTAKGLKWLSICILMFSRYILYHLTIYAGLLWHTHIKPRTTSLQSNLQSWWRRLWRKSQTQSNFSNSTSTFNSDPGETIELPRTGDEAVKRLLACRDKDLYSILGVARNSTEEEIKKHYKKQAMLVHPDKNKNPGTEEAFKILAQAFETLGNEASHFYCTVGK
jgi:hypothetical protein